MKVREPKLDKFQYLVRKMERSKTKKMRNTFEAVIQFENSPYLAEP